MTVKKLYRDDVYQQTVSATVTDLKIISENTAAVYLDRTVFFPEGGGQSCDLGTIDDLEVIDVQENGDDVMHKVKAASPADFPDRGSSVLCRIDWPRRFDNMQRHCGEHILSGMFHREYGGVNRGFHMGSEYMTIDISLEDDPKYTHIDMEMALHAEACTNEAIWADLPVVTRHYSSRSEAEDLPLRKKLNIDNDITIVSVGSIENPSDCVACCGTHPSTSGQVGLVKIFKVEKNKKMFRIYFEAGKRALKDYDEKHSIITAISRDFSAGPEGLPEKIRLQEERLNKLNSQLTDIKKAMAKEKAEMISASPDIYFCIDPLTVDDGLHIGKLTDKAMLALHVESAGTLLLFSDGSVDCGALVKGSSLKGGGNNTMARVMGSSDELKTVVDTFINTPAV